MCFFGHQWRNMSGCHTHHSAAGMMNFALPWFPQQNANGILDYCRNQNNNHKMIFMDEHHFHHFEL